MINNTTTQYGAVARALHWWTAIFFFTLFGLGLYMTDLDKTDPLRDQLFSLHISLGILVFGLTLIRIIWKIKQVTPEMPSTMTPSQVKAAKSVYGLLYLLLLFIPISGYVIVATAGKDPSFFGLFTLPNLIGENKELHKTAEEVHELLAYSAMLLVIGHTLMALKHHFIDKDKVLLQMLGKADR
jgi:cytochrome b561